MKGTSMPARDLEALVVDDDAIARKMLAFALKQEGFRCDVAEDGVQAEMKIARKTYDLVVTDLKMPNKHGHSLAVDLLKMERRPVIVIHTSLDDPRLTKDLMSRGVDDIMYKPVQAAAFAAKAKSLVSRRRNSRPAAVATESFDESLELDKTSTSVLSNDIGRYQVIRELGRGNMATVYLAKDLRLERDVALKILRTDGDDANGSFDRFQEEAKTAATLSHPGICPVYDVGTAEGRHYIAMGFIEGNPLSRYISPERKQPERQIALVVRKLARALSHAHKRGIVHRDLKPSNIMIDSEGRPVITDFGLAARMGEANVRLTQAGQIVGTPAYMSPEQANGETENIGPPSDVYSLGVILYQLLTNQLPFDGSVVKVIYMIVTEEPEPPTTYRADIDPRVEDLCLTMMAKSIEDRPPSMEAVADTLGEFLSSTSQRATSTAVAT